MSFTSAQQGRYRPVVEAAWAVEVALGDGDGSPAAKNAWYRQQLLEATGEYTTKALSKVRGFDTAMLHFAILAGDDYWMGRCSAAEERRIRWYLRRYLLDLSYLEKREVHWDYVRAIWTQSKQLPDDPKDAPAPILLKVLQMLNSHICRICRDYGILPKELPSRSGEPVKPHAIDPEAKHFHIGHDLDRYHTDKKEAVHHAA